MRTVPTLCASSAGIGISALGLSLVTDDHHSADRFHSARHSLFNTPTRDMSLTTTSVFTFSASNSSPAYTFTTPDSIHRSSSHYYTSNPRSTRSVSDNADLTLKARGREPRASLPAASERSVSVGQGDTQTVLGNRVPRRRTWLRRFSSSMSSSRDSSRTPQSRPASAAVSYSNGAVAFSNADSTDPIVSSLPAQLPPNKLVKRSSSIRSAKDIPSTSRLPLPTFKRPATSHQRMSMLQNRLSASDPLDHASDDNDADHTRDQQWRSYFVPRTARDDAWTERRRSSSIPNPIKRIYPDRRYRPTLVSGREAVAQAQTEYDEYSSNDGSVIDLPAALGSSVASSPMLRTTTNFEQERTAKRSFSIGDLLSTGPKSQRPTTSSSNGRSRLLRRTRRPVTSQSDMGSAFSISNADPERASKRRVVSSRDSLSEQQAAIGNETPVAVPASQRMPSDPLLNTSRSSSIEQRRVLSAPFSVLGQRSTRASTNTSEFTSGGDSDSELKSFGDSNTDYQSDAIFDSIPTRTTRSSSGRRGPPIDTIFDDTPPSFSSGKSTKLKDFLNQDSFVLNDNAHRYSTIEEEESISTPVRSVRDKSIASSPTARQRSSIFSSSPPTMREMPDPDDIDWDVDDSDVTPGGERTWQTYETMPMRSLPLRFAPTSKGLQPTSTPQRNGMDRATIFDWSEVQPSPSHDQSPPRPRTVHGKKDTENRGSRSTNRRAPSAMHARSHSVPVAPDTEGKRSNAVANKFGTWGVGTKNVTEDWNEDFDFDDDNAQPVAESSSAADKRIDSGHEIFVPRSIREQQDNVVANIGLLREWGLLIEELKELRVRAVALDMLTGPHAQAWSEVDAMVELADQETEEETLQPRASPPSSPGFDFSAFEDPPAATSMIQPAPLPEPLIPPSTPRVRAEPDVPVQSSPTRPRKDSEAVARSVIEALRLRRTVSDATSLQPVPNSRKVPFDTATLRHIVPYVNGLKRKVKDALREREGLYKSPDRPASGAMTGEAAQLRGLFHAGSPVASRHRLQRNENDEEEADGFDE